MSTPRRRSAGLLLAALLACAARARADDAVHGRLKLLDFGNLSDGDSLDAALGGRNTNDIEGEVRLMWEPRRDGWSFVLHDELIGENGGNLLLSRSGAFVPGLNTPPQTWLNLTGKIYDRGRDRLVQNIDRLSIGYAGNDYVVRVGRQALTWGAGLVFHPMDLIDPFAPYAIDIEYKPGVDMGYLQWLFDDGSDVQAVAVPRSTSLNGPVSSDQSTYALHYRKTYGQFGTTALLARDRGSWTMAAGVSGPLNGAVWNVEALETVDQAGRATTTALLNVTRGWTLVGKDLTVYGEYFHNGFGVSRRGPVLTDLPVDLTRRLADGRLFTVSADYLAAGFSYSLTPLVTLSPNAILNLNDRSIFTDLELAWSVSDNTSLKVGTQIPIGRKRTEYGGLQIGQTSKTLFAPATSLYLLLLKHF